MVNAYFPKGSGPNRDNSRVPYKLAFYEAIYDRMTELRRRGPVLVMGDHNTAHQDIDLARARATVKNSGFLPEERQVLDDWQADGWRDTFRTRHPNEEGHYTWWTYRGDCRERNIGWRIDYFFITEEVRPWVKNCYHQPLTMGSDHCPLFLELEVP